jgi:hypothetical protein
MKKLILSDDSIFKVKFVVVFCMEITYSTYTNVKLYDNHLHCLFI